MGHAGIAESTDQSSTSVLATLAALAEATGPLSTSNSKSTVGNIVMEVVGLEKDTHCAHLN